MLTKNNSSYIKNLSFYYIAHFSKFSDKIEVTVFKNPDNSVIIVLLNRNNSNIEYNLKINEKIFHDNLDAHAIVTFQILNN